MRNIIFIVAFILKASSSMAEMTYECTRQSQLDCHASLRTDRGSRSSWDQWGSCSGSSILILAKAGEPSIYRLDDFGDFDNENYSLKIPLSLVTSHLVFNQKVELIYSVDGVVKESQIWRCGSETNHE